MNHVIQRHHNETDDMASDRNIDSASLIGGDTMTTQIKRHGNHIRIEKGITAIEGRAGNLPTLTIKKNGKTIKFYRGSSLFFSTPLTDEDRSYLASLSQE